MAEQRYALMDGAECKCVALWDAAISPSWTPPFGWTLFPDEPPAYVGPGWTWNGAAWVAPPVPVTVLTPAEWFDRLTEAEMEWLAVRRRTDEKVDVWITRMTALAQIAMDNPRLVAALDRLVSLGLMTAQRRNELLV